MAVQLVPSPDYCGAQGVRYLRELQQNLIVALADKDWGKVHRLDQCCAPLIEKVVAANDDKCTELLSALSDLKDAYWGLIQSCRKEAASMVV